MVCPFSIIVGFITSRKNDIIAKVRLENLPSIKIFTYTGFKVTKEEFLNSPELQELAMQALLEHNKKKLKKYIEKYDGKVVHGVFVTESGILAAAHLAGQGNVKKFFRSGNEFRDGYGTRLTSYMVNFSGYQLDL